MLNLDAREFARLDRFERIASLGIASMHPGGLEATHLLAARTGVGAGVRLLDVGCGVGQTACLLASRYRAVVTGIDRSASMVHRARERAARTGVAASFAEGDAYALSFADETFDVVFAESVTLFLDCDRVLPELRRVLKPAGRIADIVMTCRERVPDEVLDAMERLEGVRMKPRTESEWLAAYEAAGFRVTYSEFHPSISDRAAVGSFFKDNGWAGIRGALRLVTLWLSDARVRTYMRELSKTWNEHKGRFGYGLIVAERA